VKVIDKPWLDLTTPMGKGIMTLLTALAEDERSRIDKRASAGRTAARAAGVRFGPKPKLSPHQRNVALRRKLAGDNDKEIARDFGVSRSTITRLLAAAKLSQNI